MAIFKKKTGQTEKKTAPKAKAPVSHGQHSHKPLLIQKPHVTEKSLRMSAEDKYVFIVPASVTKIEATKQIEKLYGVSCIRTHVLHGAEKTRNWRGHRTGAEHFKKVIVTLKKGQKIEITGNT